MAASISKLMQREEFAPSMIIIIGSALEAQRAGTRAAPNKSKHCNNITT